MKRFLMSLAVMVWAAFTSVAIAAYYYTDQVNQELRKQIVILRDIRTMQEQECQGIRRVNALCEQVVSEFATQLGISVSPAPILTTSIQKRHVIAIGGVGGGE